MIRIALVAVALSVGAAPAIASEWMGSFYGIGGGLSGGFNSTWHKGKIKGDLTDVFYGSTPQFSVLPFKGTYSMKSNGRMNGKINGIPGFNGKFTGWRGNGKMNGSFKGGGHFDATRTSKGKGGKKG